MPERGQDNAKYYAGKTEKDAEKTATDRKEVERLVESVSGIDEQVTKVENLTKQAQTSATNAALSEQATKESENNAAQSRAGAEVAENNAQLAAQKAEQDKLIVEQAKNLVKQMGQEVLDNKNLVDKTTQDFDLKAQQALADVNNAGQTQTERVQTAGNDAVESIKAAQGTATRAVETAKTEAIEAVQTEGTTQAGNVSAEGEKQVQAVQGAAQEIMADREQIQMNKEGVAKLKEDIGNKAPAIIKKASGKTIIINDSSNLPIKTLSGTGEIIVTGKNILKTEKKKEFIPFEAKAGTLFTLITNGELSEGGNIRFTGENDEEIWFPIDKGQTRVSRQISRNVKGYTNLLDFKEGLKYCFSVGENDKYEEYVEQVITTPVDSEQLKAIHTNYHTTVLTSENEITVEYVADTEAYIGKRIKEENQSLQNQILEIQNALISQKISGGGIIQVKDSSKLPLQNLRIFGKSEQNGVPSPDAPIPIVSVGYKRNIKVDVTGKNILPKLPAVVSNGISAYVNEDGSIKITGTATNTWSDITKVEFKHFVRNGDYIFSVDKPLDFILGIKYRKCGTIEGQIIGRIKKTETETRYRIPEDNLSEELSIFIEGITIGKLYNVTFKPMLRNAECTDSSYEPYKEPQSLTLTTPNGLPGLKVDKGGNYTDSTGQQWICDEIDLGKGKYIQRIARRIYDGSENWNIYTSQNKPNSYGCENKDKAVAFTALFNRYVSMKHFALENGQGANGEFQTIIRNDNCTTIKSLKEELSKNNLEVIMQLKKPIEYDLMPEEIQAYKVLHTNYPTTVVTNDENADMELTYTVDTKSYVDTKIAEVSTAIVQKGIE